MIKSIVHTLRTNVQLNQTIILMSILLLGIFFYNIKFDLEKLLVVFGSVIFFEVLFSYMRNGHFVFPYSGIPAWFWISFFLRTDVVILYILAGFLAISSKYIFRIQGRHFFNPSNFWVFLILILFPYITWTNPLQWWKIPVPSVFFTLLYVLICILGLFTIWRVHVNKKLNLLYIILPFLITHFSLVYFFSWDKSISYPLIYTPSFFIFTFFMITDPRTILENKISRIIFGALVAIGFFILQFFINENYALLASLFFGTCIIPLLSYFDQKNIYKNITFWNVIIFSLTLICIFFLVSLIYQHGQIDLVFDNRCRNLICN